MKKLEGSVKDKKKILVIDDDESLKRIMEFNLKEEGYDVMSASDGIAGFQLFKENDIDLVIADIRMPGMDGIDLLNRIKAISHDALVVIITAHGTIETAIEAMKLGAVDFITKPFSKNQLSVIVKRAFQIAQLIEENKNLRRAVQDRYSFENIVGKSRSMEDVYDAVSRVARSDAAVLIHGESGTGKELIAKAIHFNSDRKEHPFITVNCSAVPENLFESELFGHMKGSYTGAVSDKAGKFEAADGGTIFLDEVAEIPLHLQPKILRVLQEGEIDKIGAIQPLKVDVRIITATNRDLEEMIGQNRFREDLYYRINIVPIHLPPLRERKDDIPLLADHFLRTYAEKYKRGNIHFDKSVFPFFDRYEWPGNVRELENTVERMIIMSRNDLLKEDNLPASIRSSRDVSPFVLRDLPVDGINLEDVEKELIRKALEKNDWNQSKAAKYLGISRQTLLYRMKKHHLEKLS